MAVHGFYVLDCIAAVPEKTRLLQGDHAGFIPPNHGSSHRFQMLIHLAYFNFRRSQYSADGELAHTTDLTHLQSVAKQQLVASVLALAPLVLRTHALQSNSDVPLYLEGHQGGRLSCRHNFLGYIRASCLLLRHHAFTGCASEPCKRRGGHSPSS